MRTECSCVPASNTTHSDSRRPSSMSTGSWRDPRSVGPRRARTAGRRRRGRARSRAGRRRSRARPSPCGDRSARRQAEQPARTPLRSRARASSQRVRDRRRSRAPRRLRSASGDAGSARSRCVAPAAPRPARSMVCGCSWRPPRRPVSDSPRSSVVSPASRVRERSSSGQLRICLTRFRRTAGVAIGGSGGTEGSRSAPETPP